MIQAKHLKEIINQIPDNAYVTIGGNERCNIVGHTERIESVNPVLIIDLKLTEGYGIVDGDFLDMLFKKAIRQ